ncbi:MAG: hypothetical protein P4L10_14750 [Acidobacteriaceae bacterium]|nr:hypothetical protein [Acidobacteriaceae bacterium]
MVQKVYWGKARTKLLLSRELKNHSAMEVVEKILYAIRWGNAQYLAEDPERKWVLVGVIVVLVTNMHTIYGQRDVLQREVDHPRLRLPLLLRLLRFLRLYSTLSPLDTLEVNLDLVLVDAQSVCLVIFVLRAVVLDKICLLAPKRQSGAKDDLQIVDSDFKRIRQTAHQVVLPHHEPVAKNL